jgi:glycine cleavage system H protein
MEGFTYTNIFETKGIEYLAIITFFLVLIPFWMLLSRPVKIRSAITKAIGTLSLGSFHLPQGIFFSGQHSWTYLEKSGLAKVGVDDFLVKVIGEVNLVRLKNPGERVQKGELLGTIDQGGKKLNIYSPVTGEIRDINAALTTNPLLLLDDPYEKGWFCRIKPEKWVAETSGYYFAEGALEWVEQELSRFRDFITNALGKSNGNSQLVLQDGGELMAEPLHALSGDIWEAFQHDFIDEKIAIPEFEGFSES